MTVEITGEDLHAFGGIDRFLAENEITDLREIDAVLKGDISLYDYVNFLERLETYKTQFNSVTFSSELADLQEEVYPYLKDKKRHLLYKPLESEELRYKELYNSLLPEDSMWYYKKISKFWVSVQTNFENRFKSDNLSGNSKKQSVVNNIQLEKCYFCTIETFSDFPLFVLLRKIVGSPLGSILTNKQKDEFDAQEKERFSQPLLFDTGNSNIYDKYLFINKHFDGVELIYLPYGMFLYFPNCDVSSLKIKAFLKEWKDNKEVNYQKLLKLISDCTEEEEAFKARLKTIDAITRQKNSVPEWSDFSEGKVATEHFIKELETDEISADGFLDKGIVKITIYRKNELKQYTKQVSVDLNFFQITEYKETILDEIRSYFQLL